MHEQNLAKWIRWLVYASTAIPLVIFGQYVSPFHFGKVVLFRTIVTVMGACYLLLVWRDRSYLPRMQAIAWAFAAMDFGVRRGVSDEHTRSGL